MQNPPDVWEVITSLGTVGAVLVALGLSVVPALAQRIRQAAFSRHRLKTLLLFLRNYTRRYVDGHQIPTAERGQYRLAYKPGKVAGYLHSVAILQTRIEEIYALSKSLKIRDMDRILDGLDIAVECYSGLNIPLTRWEEMDELLTAALLRIDKKLSDRISSPDYF